MKKFVAVSAILLTMTGQAIAGNVESFGIGARATALGGAYSATADDPYAAYYNPAGLTQINSPMLSTGLSVMDPNLKAHKFLVKDKNGNSIFGPTNFSDESDDLYVPHLGFAMPINKQISIGLAAYVPYGLDVEWSPNTTKNPAAYNWFHSYYMREVVTPTVGYKVNDQFSLGLGVSLGKSKSGAEKVIYLPNAPGPLGALSAQYNNKIMKAEMEDDFNYSFNLGFMYKPVEALSLGLTYRSKADAEFDGPLKINNVKVANVELDYDHPDQIQVGVRYKPNDRVSMEADVVWTSWRHNEYQREFFKNKTVPILPSEKTYDRDWNNTNQLRLGIEWKALDYMTVRAGYFYDPSPIPDDTFDIMWPDADRKTYSIGLGFNCTKNITIDTTLQYAIAEASRIIGGESEHNLNETYNPYKAYPPLNNGAKVSLEADGNLWGYSATLNYKF